MFLIEYLSTGGLLMTAFGLGRMTLDSPRAVWYQVLFLGDVWSDLVGWPWYMHLKAPSFFTSSLSNQ
jgi:hypothetical protein